MRPGRWIAAAFFLLLTTDVRAQPLAVGDVVSIDSESGEVHQVDPVTGARTLIATIDGGGAPPVLYGLAIEADRRLVVSSFVLGAVYRVDPATGSVTLLTQGDLIVQTGNLAVEADGTVLLANTSGIGTSSVLRIDPVTGVQTTLSQGGFLQLPLGITVALDGSIYVSDFTAGANAAGAVIRVDPVDGGQTLVASGDPGGPMASPTGIDVEDDGNLVTAAPVSEDVVRVNPTTGARTVITSGVELTWPWDVAVEASGDLLVGEIVLAKIVRVDPGSGVQTLLSSEGRNRRVAVVRPACSDRLDNDGDGGVDWNGSPADPDCSGPNDTETPPKSCGLGCEVAFALAAIALQRRRWRTVVSR